MDRGKPEMIWFYEMKGGYGGAWLPPHGFYEMKGVMGEDFVSTNMGFIDEGGYGKDFISPQIQITIDQYWFPMLTETHATNHRKLFLVEESGYFIMDTDIPWVTM